MAKDDFFEKAPEKKGGSSTKKSKSTKEPTKPSGGIAYTVNLYLAIGLVIAAFAIGFFVGGMVWPAPESTPSVEDTTTTQQAPPLSEDEINQGQMPPGHPSVAPGTTETPSATETPSSDAPSGETTP